MDGINIFRSEAADDAVFSAVHVNLWVLPSFLSRFKIYLDIGILISRPSAKKASTFYVTLPITCEKNNLRDLSDVLMNENTMKLVFGHARYVGDRIIQIFVNKQERSAFLARISVDRTEVRPVGTLGTKLHIALEDSANGHDNVYTRFRVPLETSSRIWFPRGVRGGGRASLDFKLNDKRSFRGMDEPLDDRFSESEEVNFYAVIPAMFEPTMTALEPTYTRTLEGATWNHYLSRRLRPNRQNDLLVYGWKYGEVSIREPARAYGSFAFHRSSPIVTLVSAVALSSIIVGLVVWLANAYLPADPNQVISQLGSDGSRWLRWLFVSVIGGGSLLALLSKVTALRKIGKTVRTRVRSAVDWLDRKLATDTNYDP